MTVRTLRRRIQKQRQQAVRRFTKHCRKNLLAKPGIHDIMIVLDHLKPTFNVGKIFRSADAFGAKKVHLVGIDFFDPAPAKGSFKYVPASFHNCFTDCYSELKKEGYSIFAMAPDTPDSLLTVPLPVKSAFVFGHEELGFSFSFKDFPDIQPLHIPQFGRVESLNVSIAASITLYEYCRQHPLQTPTVG